jgi:hypothetical protein
MTHTISQPQMAAPRIASADVYQRGGWTDGRLGQAYDLLDAVMRDQHPEHDSRQLAQQARDLCESIDCEIGGAS